MCVLLQVFVNNGTHTYVHSEVGASVTSTVITGLKPGLNYTVLVASIIQVSTRRLADPADGGCAGGGCHTPTPRLGGGLDLDVAALSMIPEESRRQLVDVVGDDIGGVTVINATTSVRTNEVRFLSTSGTFTFGEAGSYAASSNQEAVITFTTSDSLNAIDLEFTNFDLECDHDKLTVSLDGVDLWSGGCRRPQFTFTLLAIDDGLHTVRVRLDADESVQGSGVTFKFIKYFRVSGAGHVLGSPGDCPVNPVAGTCTDDRHGTCTIDGTCGCNAGYGGEDCRSPLMCPGEFCGDTNVIGVAPFGSDAMGTGAVTDGTVVPKPYLTLSHALSVSGDNATILMYPGTYPDDCGLTHSRSGTRIVSVSHVLPYTLRAIMNCANSPGTSFMTITDGNLLVRSLFASAAFTQ